jgi:SAM-dependent methyltransferase
MATNDIEVLRRHVELDGADAVDVGCGGGQLARELAALGARVIAMEIDEDRLAAARAAGPAPGPGEVRFVVGRAEAMPLPDAGADLVLLRASLHHVEPGAMRAALSEAARVLRPGGLVYAAEPLAEGDFYSLVQVVDDEDEVRVQAQRVLADPPAGLEMIATEDYELPAHLHDLDTLRRRMVAVDPGRAAVFDEHRHELEHRFATLGEAAGESRRFTETMRVVVLRAS